MVCFVSAVINSLKGRALLAPLAGISNLPFRLIARSFGCSFAFTEMISANGLIRKADKTFEYLRTCREDKPLGVQIFGADPMIIADAAKIVESRGAELIDINMGCPVKKVIRAGAGAILMKEPDRVEKIIKAVKKVVNVPVTVKIRSGWNPSSINAVEIARIAEDAGADAIIIHARTANQGFGGAANWNIIKQVKKVVSIPVIGNGDIRQPQDALRMLRETSCDAAMVGRGALGSPWIFKGIIQLCSGKEEEFVPCLEERLKIIKSHWKMESEFLGEKSANKNFRKHLLWYTKGLENSTRFRQMAGKLSDKESVMNELNEYFRLLSQLQAVEGTS
ncbi:MAG: tRNA dihydrouridine synthase DusB [Deltaproteobacteria bacterium RBG_19FT_COMBO_43_11]|nr:MAG: tRNA dihydrouridine synthase DusB [Deltaproteobacteria bacterium RBG_19FT_COMBO_43_11]